MRVIVCREDELENGQKKVIYKGKVPIVVVRTASDEYYAVHGLCPHQGANLGGGKLTCYLSSDNPGIYEVSRDGEILRCPWHSFEFEVNSGACITDQKMKVKKYPVYIEDGNIMVEV